MKQIVTIFFFTVLFFKAEAQNSCTFSDHGTSNTYTLNSGDVLCIESGTFTGTIANFDLNAEVRVSAGATFQPLNMQNVQGLISNKGTVKLLTNNIIGYNFSVVNDSGGLFQWNVAQTFTGPVSILNNKNAEMNFFSAFDVSSSSNVLNEGMMIVKNELSVQPGAVFTNECVLYVWGNLTTNGILFNSGLMKIAGYTNINSGSYFTNKCTFYGKNTCTNASSLTENYGYIYIYGNDADNCKFINQAHFYNDSTGIVQSNSFDNHDQITGAGSFSALNLSRNFGNFGADGGGLNFFDMTPSGNQIFDVQTVLPHNSVSSNIVNIYDTTYISANCGQIVFPDFINTPLPVQMTTFETTAPDCIPQIYWSTSQEVNSDYFELQRKSSDELQFTKVATIAAAGHSDVELAYNYTDEQLSNGNYQYRLKIVDIDGRYTYSRVSNVQVFCGNTSLTNVYPNPATDILNIAFNTNADDTYQVSVFDITGRLVYKNSYDFGNGFQNISLPVDQLQPGYYALLLTNSIKTESFKFLKN